MGILKFIGVVNTGNAVKVVLISGLFSICLAVEIFSTFIDVISPDQLLMLFGLFVVGGGLVSAGIGMAFGIFGTEGANKHEPSKHI